MNEMWAVLVRKYKFLRFMLPVGLPIGDLAFDDFCTELFQVYQIPDFPSYRNAIATMIMHLGPTKYYKSPFYFCLAVKKAQANQVAYEVTQRIREQEKEKLKSGEDTPQPGASHDESVPIEEIQGPSEDLVQQA